jgi:hypothetical protein
MSILGIPSSGFLDMRRNIKQAFTTTFSTTERKNPITMIRDATPGYTGCLYHSNPIASRKHMLQMKAVRLSILNKAMVQKSKFLHKIALFCLNNQFHSNEFIPS